MARRGSFSGGLNPFGGGTLGNLAQYDVGADLADLSVYQTEVAWGNGQATDADYLNALRQAAAATDPGTQRSYSAQNKLDDAVYRIGRSVAESQGLDALIAFDQAAISTMNQDNLRYRNVEDSLDSEMAQRRSRDYGELVRAYNEGDLPTEALLSWVSQTLGTISPDDPDFANWTNVRGDLGERIDGEKDSAVFQDYQRGRMEPQAFLAYLTARRDSFGPNSPKYDEWSNKLEDATVQIKEAAQSKADSTFFALYQAGKKSDASYLLYLRRRIDGMPADDPQRGEWQSRLNQAAFSLAEDKLRFDAQRAANKVDANPSSSAIKAANAASGKLLDFYTAYRTSLNPGSAEWRTVTRSIDTLARQLAAPAPKAGGGKGKSSGSGKVGAPTGSVLGAGPALTGKLINPKYNLSNILGLFTINPTGDKKAVAGAKKFLALNKSALDNALNRGDDVWLFQDPRTPGAVVTALDPNGAPVLDKNGKPVLVRGSAWLPVQNETLSYLKMAEATNFMSAAEVALAKGKYGDYAYNLRRAGETLDSARLGDSQAREQNWNDWYKATEIAVDKLTMAGDYGQAIRTATDLASRLARERQNAYLDDTRRDRLDELGEKLADNKIMPKANPDGSSWEGAVNISELDRGNTVLNPGWHHVLKSNDRGQPAWGPVFDAKQDGSWDSGYVTVYTTLGDKLVKGEAAISDKARLDPKILVRTAEGWKTIDAGKTTVMLSFVDQYGQVQRAYSLDGRTWIRPAPGAPAPTLVIDTELTMKTDAEGIASYVDAQGNIVVLQNAKGGWDTDPAALSWYGQTAWEQAKKTPAGKQQLEFDPGDVREARRLNVVDAARMDMGGLGQQMTLAYASPSGIVNLTPAGYRTQAAIIADKRRLASMRTKAAPELFGPPRPAVAAPYGSPLPSGAKAQTDPFLREADARRGAARPVSYQDIASQLPDDTPDRYDGYSSLPPPAVVAQLAPSTILPGLVGPTP